MNLVNARLLKMSKAKNNIKSHRDQENLSPSRSLFISNTYWEQNLEQHFTLSFYSNN